MDTATNETAQGVAPAAPKAARKPAAKKAPKKAGKQAKSGAKLVKKAPSDGTPLKTICAKLKIEPRLARRKLRAAKLSFHDHRERWTFTPSQTEKVTEILRA